MTFAKVYIVGDLMLLPNPVDFDTAGEVIAVGYALVEFAISTTYGTFPVVTNVRTTAITVAWRAYVSFYWFLDKTSQVRSKDGLFPQLSVRGPVSKSPRKVKMSFLLAKPFLCL